MSTKIYNKIYDFLTTAEECRINAMSVIYLGMKENRWISQIELKMNVERAVASASNVFMKGSSRQLKIFRILPQKPVRQMTPAPMTIVKEICENFVTSFIDHNIQNTIPDKLIHDKSWKESEEKIVNVIKEVLILLEDIWINPAFNSELAKSLNEGTY
ncbi:20682_t:CDS:2 [Funneliformis geosporum]|nr:20682_t:CDS:2 [Funneliformis geosporum]